MSIFKDWRDEVRGSTLTYKLTALVSLKVWRRLHRNRKQRADRGWSEADTWEAGDYVLEVTLGLIKYMYYETDKDWRFWSERLEKDGYVDIKHVIHDLSNYLDHQKSHWTDTLSASKDGWVDAETGERITHEELNRRMNDWHEKGDVLAKKATKAMTFFANNFQSFWD